MYIVGSENKLKAGKLMELSYLIHYTVILYYFPGEKLHRIFKDLLEDLGEDLRKDPQQRSLKILKDPNFSCQDPQKSLQRSLRIFEDLCKISKDL